MSITLESVQNVIQSLVAAKLNWARENPGKASLIGSAALYILLKNLTKKYKSVKGKLVLVTGGASGIGYLMAENLAKLGANIVIWDICGQEKLDDICETLRSNCPNSKIYGYRVDITDKPMVDSAAEVTISDAGQVDILINNAGIVSGKPILELKQNEVERTFKVNAISHFWTIQNFLPSMIERNSGHIVTIASAAGHFGCPKLTDYCASKFAAVGIDESLRLELKKMGKTGVKTTCVCPFYIKTGMFKGARTKRPLTMPIVSPEYASSKIVEAIRLDQEFLTIPNMVGLGLAVKYMFPVWLSDKASEFIGTSESMDYFIGRKDE